MLCLLGIVLLVEGRQRHTVRARGVRRAAPGPRQARGERSAVRQKEVDEVVMSMGDGLLLERMQVCKLLWDHGINAEFLYKKKPKLQAQFAVVDKEQIPYAVMLAPGEWAQGKVRVKQQLGKEEAGADKGEEVALADLCAYLQEKQRQ